MKKIPVRDAREDLINGLQLILKKGGGDAEADHFNADQLLIRYIADAQVTELFDKIDKWYA